MTKTQPPRLYALATRYENMSRTALNETLTYASACRRTSRKSQSAFWTNGPDERSRSIALIRDLAQSLNNRGITHYHISTGLREKPDQGYPVPYPRTWEVAVFFGTGKRGTGTGTGMSDFEIAHTRQIILSHIYPAQPSLSQEKTVDNYRELPEALKYRIENGYNLQHKSQFAVWDGRPYLIQRDGRVDYGVLEEYQWTREGEERVSSPLGRGREKVGRVVSSMGRAGKSSREVDARRDSMAEALDRLVQPATGPVSEVQEGEVELIL
ncbi:hypothetical protein BDV06DRAFT_219182 [Aspergillus oleicola]